MCKSLSFTHEDFVYFSMYFLFKYIEFESEAHKRWKNLMENSKIWAHSSDG